MPVPTGQKLAALIDDVGPERLADLLGVDRVRLVQWLGGEQIDDENASRVDFLDAVMASLLRLCPSEAALRWLAGLNPNLGGRRPEDLIRRGHADEVLDAIAAMRANSFA